LTKSKFGNSGIINVHITIKDDIITAVEILEQDVDTVSGATYSSEGISEAVEKALRSAEK
jgi:uncharacterized protein with FMN-binding domain